MIEKNRNEVGTMDKKPLSDEILTGINGGVSSDPNKAAFSKAWKQLGFDKEERTAHEMYELYDEWEASGFSISASDFLSKHK